MRGRRTQIWRALEAQLQEQLTCLLIFLLVLAKVVGNWGL